MPTSTMPRRDAGRHAGRARRRRAPPRMLVDPRGTLGRSTRSTSSTRRTLDGRDVADKLATTASPKFLGLFRGLFYDYEIFDASMLQRDLARVERYYRGHGFLDAHARAGRVVHVGDGSHVRVEIVVDEGPRPLVRNLRVDGLDDAPPDIAADVRAAAASALPAGARFDEDAYAKAKTAVARALTDRGYAYATVKSDAQADLAAHTIDYVVHGPARTPGGASDRSRSRAGDRRPEEAGTPLSSMRACCGARSNINAGEPYSTAAHRHGDPGAARPRGAELRAGRYPTLRRSAEPGRAAHRQGGSPRKLHVDPPRRRPRVRRDQDRVARPHRLGGPQLLRGPARLHRRASSPGVVLYPTRVGQPRGADEPAARGAAASAAQAAGLPGSRERRSSCSRRATSSRCSSPSIPRRTPRWSATWSSRPRSGLERRFGKRLIVRVLQNVQAEHPFAYTTLGLEQQPPRHHSLLPGARHDARLPRQSHPPALGLLPAQRLSSAAGLGGSAADVRIQPEARGYLPIVRRRDVCSSRVGRLPLREELRRVRAERFDGPAQPRAGGEQQSVQGGQSRHRARLLPRLLLGGTEHQPRLPAPGHRAPRRRPLLEPRDRRQPGAASGQRRERRELLPRGPPLRPLAVLDPHRWLHAVGGVRRVALRHLGSARDGDVLRLGGRRAGPGRDPPEPPAPVVRGGRALRHPGGRHPARRRLPHRRGHQPDEGRHRGRGDAAGHLLHPPGDLRSGSGRRSRCGPRSPRSRGGSGRR